MPYKMMRSRLFQVGTRQKKPGIKPKIKVLKNLFWPICLYTICLLLGLYEIMKFKYKKYPPNFLRPVIPITLVQNGIEVSYQALIDSGSDICIFDAGLLEILEINLTSGERRELIGATGQPAVFYFHLIGIKVGGWKYNIKAGFMPRTAALDYGLVGQQGFFNIFTVKFDLIKEEIELKEIK